MADCESVAKCPFFNDQMANMPAMSGLMKTQYCQGDKTQCARFQVKSAGCSVPPDLLPNNQEQARHIIARARG